MDITISLITTLVLTLINGYFSMSEMALTTAKRAVLEHEAEEGDKRAERAIKLAADSDQLLATIQVAITLSGFLGSAFAADNFSEPLVDWVVSLGLTANTAVLDTVAVVIITLILSYLTLIFGELVPKRLAMKNAEGLALALSGLVSFISVAFKPIVSLLTASTNGMLRLLRVDPDEDEDVYSEEEIRMMATAGSQKGTIGAEENEFIQKLFEFDDLRAEDFATHRTQMSVLWAEGSTADWEREIFSSRHSLYPVCRDSTDKVVGILDIKDYFALPERGVEAALKSAVKEPYFVPDSIKADVLFRRMREEHLRLVVVLDEYGGVTGIVTLSDEQTISCKCVMARMRF